MKLLKTTAFIFILAIVSLAQNNPSYTITNADLEKYRAARVQSDTEYLKTYEKRGLPSPTELERRTDESLQRIGEYSYQVQVQRQQTAVSYQAQANALLNQISSIDGQIGYFKTLSSAPVYSGSPIFGYSSGYSYAQPYRYSPPQRTQSGAAVGQNVQAARDQAGNFANIPPTAGQGPVNYPGPLGARSDGRGYGGYYAPVIVNGGNFTQAEASSRLAYLYQMRAGMVMQLNALVDQARRAGVNIY